jgi:preprotein translocase subunit YajC
VNAVISLIAQEKSGGGLTGILILVLPLAALMYLMIIPQRKQRQKQAQFVSNLGVGDEVVTAGGIYGTITYMEDGVAHLEVDTDVVIRVSVASVTRAAAEPDPSEASARRGGLLGNLLGGGAPNGTAKADVVDVSDSADTSADSDAEHRSK